MTGQPLWGSTLAICCRGALIAFLAGSRWHSEFCLPLAIGRIGDARRGLIDGAVVPGGATTSKVIAGREPAKRKCSTGMSMRTWSDHEVSILITAVDAAGR